MVDDLHVMTPDNVLQLLNLGTVDVLERAFFLSAPRRHHAKIARNDCFDAIALPEGRYQFRTDLAEGACNQNFTHVSPFFDGCNGCV